MVSIPQKEAAIEYASASTVYIDDFGVMVLESLEDQDGGGYEIAYSVDVATGEVLVTLL